MQADELTPGELAAWTAGYLAGWDRAWDPEQVTFYETPDAVKRARVASERAGAARAWREAVLRGENPTPYEPEGDS